jgi:hypothetical protein
MVRIAALAFLVASASAFSTPAFSGRFFKELPSFGVLKAFNSVMRRVTWRDTIASADSLLLPKLWE